MSKYSSSGRLTPGTVFARILLFVLCTAAAVLLFAYGVIWVLCKGPSEQAERLFVLSTNETSGVYWMPNLVLSAGEIDSIINPVPDVVPEMPKPIAEEAEDPFVELEWEPGATIPIVDPEESESGSDNGDTRPQETEITIVDVKGPNYIGKLMIIPDPSKVIVGTLDHYGSGYYGLYLSDFIEKYNAVGGTNAGGFEDVNGTGNGGTPDGLVIQDGKLVYGSPNLQYVDVIGFDADHVLHVGDMTGQQALNLGLVTAVSFDNGPVLIENGVRRPNLGGGLNPRTCIGQREDGAVILCVIEGRQAYSLGATFGDLADLMLEYGCVNAANLDGGSSSQMIYQGEQIVRGSNLIGLRRLATAIIVLE